MSIKKWHFACHVSSRNFYANQDPGPEILAQIRAFPVDFKIKVLSAYANQRQAIRDLQTGAGRAATYENGQVVEHPPLPVVVVKKKRITKPIEAEADGGDAGGGGGGGGGTSTKTLDSWELMSKRREIDQLQAQLDAINAQFPDARDEVRVVVKEVEAKGKGGKKEGKEGKEGKGGKKAVASTAKVPKKKKRAREEEEEEEEEEEDDRDEEYDDDEEEEAEMVITQMHLSFSFPFTHTHTHTNK